MTAEEKQFIRAHLEDEISELLLHPPKHLRDRIGFFVEQIQSRQKAKGKLSSWVANFDLLFPPPRSIEQCSSELTAKYKSTLLSGDLLVDLTGGMGIDTIALSESFRRTVYVEANPRLCELMSHNSKILGLNIEVFNTSAESFLNENKLGAKATFFIDPARRDKQAKKVFKFSECTPDITQLLPQLEQNGDRLLVKASPLIDLQLGIFELKSVSQIHVVSVKNDCKEVLFLLDFSSVISSPILIRTINLSENVQEVFDFTKEEEDMSSINYSPLKKNLLLPNASILKAGAFKSIGVKYQLNKLHPNTHLYTSEKPIENFTGRQFEVLLDKVDKATIKALLPTNRVNVITRNYPLTPAEILKKFKLKEGGEQYILGFRDHNNIPQLVLARKILESSESD